MFLAILGPTASGKSELALQLARQWNAEILACDSMTVYRGMNIGTAKPSLALRREIRHHCIDICDIKEAYAVQRYVHDAISIIEDARKRRKPLILCGGTGLYARALLYDYTFLPHDKKIAVAIQQDYENYGQEQLVKELAMIDPKTAEKVNSNKRRLCRALEIIRIQQTPIAYPEKLSLRFPCQQWIVIPDSKITRHRIEVRVERMLATGWIEETKDLFAKGFLDTPTASQALGYSLIAQHLMDIIPSLADLKRQLINATARYAKRQRTWFRHQHPDAKVVDSVAKYESIQARID